MSEETMNKDGNNAGEFASEADEIAALQNDAAASHNDDKNSPEALKKQIEALTSDLQRERAEFTNFRKRAVLERAQQSAQSSARLLTDLLPALDALDQFFSVYTPKAESDTALKPIVDGVQLVQKQIARVFTEAGVEEFSPTGEEFDPNMMEALSVQETDVERETVVQVFQKGYRIEGRLIRPARVVVAKPKPAEAPSQ
ncbi:nucleotide exchange factor GrpE [Turneriella parva]|uniref:Protein GrpE n=1 Tax=Turneriella parva (strain ATCC BAA-1111 / DSM 21527 / NCTC 11395 / H) TaxID=869212 RepID=I4BAJ0_TURPD|nr:nucleotide exchange factor GrpE [Turneriella parva]AFM14297.1 Protein grpE [Turneriella parva DSM 21527]